MKETVEIISNVGFPITCVIFLWSFYIIRVMKLKKEIQKLEELISEKTKML